MSDRADTWMPLYIGDYLADTSRLNAAQHGAYLLLLMDYWRNGPPPVDDSVLATITRQSIQDWRKMKAVVLGFFTVEGGALVNKRAEQERGRASEITEKRREAGRASAAARARRGSGGGNDPSASVGTHAATHAGTSVPTNRPANGQQNARPSQSHSSLRSESPRPPNAGLPPDLKAVVEAGGFVSPPGDARLLAEWQAAGARLEHDILPIVRREADGLRGRTGKPPRTLKLFDQAVREKLAADAAEIARLERVAREWSDDPNQAAGRVQ